MSENNSKILKNVNSLKNLLIQDSSKHTGMWSPGRATLKTTGCPLSLFENNQERVTFSYLHAKILKLI